VLAQIGLFVADVTSVLAEEESEAAKRYSRSAMGKSFSRKRSTMLPVAQERHSRASSVKPKWWLNTSFLPTFKSYSRKSWFRAVVFLLYSYYRSFCFIDTAIIWCFSLRHVLHTYIIWHCRKRVDSAQKKPRYPQRFRQEYQGRPRKQHPPPPGAVVAFFHHSGAEYKTADLLAYYISDKGLHGPGRPRIGPVNEIIYNGRGRHQTKLCPKCARIKISYEKVMQQL